MIAADDAARPIRIGGTGANDLGEIAPLDFARRVLRQALADRRVIEQAKGVLMKVTGVDERAAFRRLQELASDKNQKLIEAAQAVLALEKALRPAEEK